MIDIQINRWTKSELGIRKVVIILHIIFCMSTNASVSLHIDSYSYNIFICKYIDRSWTYKTPFWGRLVLQTCLRERSVVDMLVIEHVVCCVLRCLFMWLKQVTVDESNEACKLLPRPADPEGIRREREDQPYFPRD